MARTVWVSIWTQMAFRCLKGLVWSGCLLSCLERTCAQCRLTKAPKVRAT